MAPSREPLSLRCRGRAQRTAQCGADATATEEAGVRPAHEDPLPITGPPFASCSWRSAFAAQRVPRAILLRFSCESDRFRGHCSEQNGRHRRACIGRSRPNRRQLAGAQLAAATAAFRFSPRSTTNKRMQSLAMATPASVYQPSWRPYPDACRARSGSVAAAASAEQGRHWVALRVVSRSAARQPGRA